MKKTKRVYVTKEVGVIHKLWHIFLTLVLKREIKVYGRPKFPHGKPNNIVSILNGLRRAGSI